MKSPRKDSEVVDMAKIAKIIYFVVPMLVLLTLTAIAAYEFGERRTAERILHSDFPAEQQRPLVTTSENEKLLSDQLNRLTNDYESACYRYQELYAAYDTLYAQAGASLGKEKIVRPDGARGSEVSCYH